MNLSEPFIRKPVMTAVLTVSVIVFGILSYLRLPVNDLPVVDYPVISVQANYPGASPDTVANNIATPLERQFMQINGLELVTSQSTQGHVSFTLQFALDKSIDAAATDVQTAISQASGSLPTDLPSPPTYSKTNPNDQPILYIALTSDSVTGGRLYDYGSTQVGQRISILPGVSSVNVFGTKSAVRIKVDPSKMWARGISIDDLTNAVKNGTSYIGAGQFDSASGTALLQPNGQLEDAASYGNLIVSSTSAGPVYLRDVANVEDTVQDERIRMKFWVRGYGEPAATVVVAVNRQAGSNVVAVAKSVRDLLPIISAELPASVRVTPIYDRSQTIVNSVADVQATLIFAFVLVVAVIFVFLGRATDTLIPAVALPLSLLITFMAMRQFGYSLDNLSLMALTLAIGFLVDDAIVFLENTVRLMERGMKPLEASLESAREISFTILSMTVSLAAVFFPLVFMSGLVGRIFREFAITIVVSIFASGLVSLTLTPLMCARLLKPRGHGVKQNWVERTGGKVEKKVLQVYGDSLWWFLRHRWISALTWVACMAGTILLFMAVPKSFLPVGDSSFIWGVMIGKEGSSPEQMHALQDQAGVLMRDNPAVGATFTMSGNGQFLASNQGLLLAFLYPPQRRAPIEAVAGGLMGRLATIPGIFPFLRPFPVLEISTGATNTNQGQYAYSVSGVNSQQVYDVAQKLMGKMMEYPGFATVNSDFFDHTPNLEINIRRDQTRTYGVSEARILNLLRNAYSQNYLYLIKKPEDQYQVILEVKDSERAHANDLSLLYIRSDDGKNLVPLNALVDWKTTLGPQNVNHLNQFTAVTIYFNLKPDVAIGDATNYISKAAAEVVPLTIRASLQGEALTFRDTVRDLTFLMVLAVFIMYVILAILYESYVHPLTVLSTLPTALVGGLLTLYLFGEQASLYAFVGMFMLMGIVKKNGIMIVDFARHRVDAGETAENAIHEASIDRFRPILMTTLAAVIGAVPIAAGYGADGASRRPLGMVIVGGLVVSQFITLYVTPVIYLYLEQFQEKVLNRTSFFHSGHLNAFRRRANYGSGRSGGLRRELSSTGFSLWGFVRATSKSFGTKGHRLKPVLLGCALSTAFLASCKVGPDYKRPNTDVPTAYRGPAAAEAAASASTQSLGEQKWWDVFQDEQLQKLIRTALQQNYDSRIAATHVLEAQEQVGLARANQLPNVNVSGTGTGLRNPSTGPIPAYTFNYGKITANAAWDVDFWGKYRRATEAARANLLAADWARQEVNATLVANVAAAYFQLRELDLELEISQRALASRKESLDLTKTLEEHGINTILDVRQAEQLVYIAAADIADLNRRIGQQEDYLSILLGNNPGPISPRGKELIDQPHPPAVPAGLPSALLERRPDIRQSEQLLVAANAKIGVARAAYFPDISLTAQTGFLSSSLGSLFSGSAGLWNFAGTISEPIFEGGALRSNVRLAEAQRQEAVLTYQQTIQGAFRDVSDALIAYQQNQEFRTQEESLARAAEDAARLSGKRYEAGTTNYLEVLTNETNYLTADLGLAQARLNELLALVQIYKALGGGWQQ